MTAASIFCSCQKRPPSPGGLASRRQAALVPSVPQKGGGLKELLKLGCSVQLPPLGWKGPPVRWVG
jgi:hypothetical protein